MTKSPTPEPAPLSAVGVALPSTFLAALVAGGVVGAVLAAGVPRLGGMATGLVAGLGLAAAGASCCTLAGAARLRTFEQAVLLCLGAVPAAFAAAAVAGLALARIYLPRVAEIPGEAMALAFVAAAVHAVPVGAAVGAFTLPAARLLATERARRSHEDGDRALRSCGAHLAVVGAVGTALCLVVLDADCAHRFVVAAPLALVPSGIVASLVGARRLRRREAWIDAVLHGELEGWAVMAPDRVSPCDLELPPLFRGGAPSAVVVRLDPQGTGGAYRAGRHPRPVALL